LADSRAEIVVETERGELEGRLVIDADRRVITPSAAEQSARCVLTVSTT